MSVLAFTLLIVALLLFILSTRQWSLAIRGGVWGAGLIALVAAIFLSAQSNHGGLFGAFGDFIAHFDRPGESVLVQAIAHNLPQVGRFVLPMLDFFLIIAVLLAILTIIAFTPGETLERIARPIAIGLVGAVFGGVFALAIVGTGIGDVAQQQVYSTYAHDDDAYNGDTLFVGEVSVRLAGIDAPHLDQICRGQSGQSPCGEEARRHLQNLITGALLTCERVGRGDGDGDDRETFARPRVRCTASHARDSIDVGEQMVADGYAIATDSSELNYRGLARIAADEQRGIMGLCTLRPNVWRANARVRQAFIERATIPRDINMTIGRCPLPRTPNHGPSPEAP
ncbi:MAG: thermonuclease family protein [Proteobacteria bacterium]|nr:thermonuclease family protein [Pseudomonadota bacterium]